MTTPLMKPSSNVTQSPGPRLGIVMDDKRSSPANSRQVDRALVERMVEGDESAFETFSDDYIPALYRFALYRLSRDRDLAEEIVQTTLVKVMGKLSTFRGDAALMTWLCACCRMEIAAHFRRNGRRPREVEWSEDDPSEQTTIHGGPPEGPDKSLIRRESRELVHAALDMLPPHYGKALEWKYLEDLSVKEIAERLNTTAKAVESRLTRARDAFRDVYARQLNRQELRLTSS